MLYSSADKDRCSAHYIRTVVLKELVLNALNKLLDNVKDNEAEFVQTAMDNSASKHSSDVFKAKKALNQAEKRIAELDRLLQDSMRTIFRVRSLTNVLLYCPQDMRTSRRN